MKAIFLPGNGGGSPKDNWFPYLQRELEKLNIEVIVEELPDSQLARAAYWLPFLKKLHADKNTILIGHSSDLNCFQNLSYKSFLNSDA